MEKPFKPQMENGFSINGSSLKNLYQNLSGIDHFSLGSSSPKLSLGVSSSFCDPFDPFRTSSANASRSSNPIGCKGSNHYMHGNQNEGFRRCTPRKSWEGLNQGETLEEWYKKRFESKKKKRSQRKRSNKSYKNLTVVKGQWSAEEDKLLMQLVKKYGEKKWANISQMMNGRVGKQCRERWHNHLRPNIKKEEWTEEEEIMLIEAHREIGNKWAAIARRMPWRTENAIKNHWNATKRRRTSKPNGSLLQRYIRSLQDPKPERPNREEPTRSAGKGKGRAVAVEFARVDVDDDDICEKTCRVGNGLAEMRCGSGVVGNGSREVERYRSLDAKKEMEFLEMLYRGW